VLKVLIVEDERMARETLRDFVPWRELGIEGVETAENGAEALEKISHCMPDLLLCDIRMPRIDGLELANIVRERNQECGIIFLSGYSDKDYLKTAIRVRAADYIEKPINIGEISAAVERILRVMRDRADSTAESELAGGSSGTKVDAESLRSRLATIADTYLGQGSASDPSHTSADRRIGQVKDFIRSHYDVPDLSVAMVAAHVGLSESYLCTFYRQACGVTVKDFVTQVRVSRAKDLLRTTFDKLQTIALLVGYRDANYFSTVFKREVGMTPGEYRERSRR
jgi:two-component system response regulator YesN